jgi:hypothetical protein
VDPGSDAHDLVMSLYGGMSKGERNRIKITVRTVMATPASIEGRFLVGRPPYGGAWNLSCPRGDWTQIPMRPVLRQELVLGAGGDLRCS